MDKRETPEDDPHGIATLIKTALYDTSGEMVEGGFVDRWEPYAASARDELTKIFSTHGYSERDAQIFRAIMRDPKPPFDAVVALIQGLAKYTRPLIVEMRQDPNPRARRVAVLNIYTKLGGIPQPTCAQGCQTRGRPTL